METEPTLASLLNADQQSRLLVRSKAQGQWQNTNIGIERAQDNPMGSLANRPQLFEDFIPGEIKHFANCYKCTKYNTHNGKMRSGVLIFSAKMNKYELKITWAKTYQIAITEWVITFQTTYILAKIVLLT